MVTWFASRSPLGNISSYGVISSCILKLLLFLKSPKLYLSNVPTIVAFEAAVPSEQKKYCPGAQLPLSPAGVLDEIFPLEFMNLDGCSHDPFSGYCSLIFMDLIKLFYTYTSE